MSNPILLAGSGLIGLILGICFFAGLWWTVRKGLASDRPALWFVGSMVARTATVLSGFYCVSLGGWQACGMCMLGFLIARFAVVRGLDRQVAVTPSDLEMES